MSRIDIDAQILKVDGMEREFVEPIMAEVIRNDMCSDGAGKAIVGPVLVHGDVKVYHRSDGITVSQWADNCVVTYEDAAAVGPMIEQLTPAQTQRLLIADTKNVIRTEPRARRLEPDEKNTAAIAIIVGSPVSRMFANAYLALSRPKVPMRLFADTEVAARWLKEQVA